MLQYFFFNFQTLQTDLLINIYSFSSENWDLFWAASVARIMKTTAYGKDRTPTDYLNIYLYIEMRNKSKNLF